MSAERYDRQKRLPGVGAAGQLRIERSAAHVPAGPSANVALAYLARAGVGHVEIVPRPAPPFRHAAAFAFDGPCRVAEGAHLAIVHLIEAIRTA
ncbi:MAG TPA: hypothetical protein VKY73_03320 [Polyangiaceae bacterium]|nr:MAG: hypothetical protein DIU78_00660 [Pseudomonadota bacterium]HLV64809.1 hypothetical protein [Polyangiaceae bacterium]